MSEQAIRLTQYSHGAGCGCKISPKVLETILHSEQAKFVDPNLLVGNETRDDAAVYDLGNGTSIISTTDFFMPTHPPPPNPPKNPPQPPPPPPPNPPTTP
ncbi:hypothetical protein O6V51_21560, partial [Salmonella enterica subsp. enterica]